VCRLYLVKFVDICMWDPQENLRIRPSEIEFESNFSSTLQHLRSTEYSTFLIAKSLRIKFLSNCLKFLRIIDP